ncbi:MAG: ABC transporter ATP-binding protein [Gemmatimonadaceae bacterium]|nr:ABC transporter ATP-binding protein [Gemmatimonadaceae bacterium]
MTAAATREAGHVTAITLRDVTKSFRADRGLLRRFRHLPGTAPRAVLDAVDVSVQRGEIFGLVGENGAGKTTLLKILSTVLLPDRGSVVVDGIDALVHADRVRTRLAVVPADERALFWRVSARENVRLFASLYGLTGAAREAAVDRALELVGLAHVGRQQVGSFSSGMRQRTLIARALVTRPPILILDEPTRSLDPVTARELRRFIRDVLCHELGTTIVLATHSTEEALQLCDRAALIVRGRIVATDTLSRLYAAVGGARVRVRVDATHESRARTLLHLPSEVSTPSIDGFVTLTATLPDMVHAPVVVEALVRAGVRVAEFAPVALTLADLLETASGRVVDAGALPHA